MYWEAIKILNHRIEDHPVLGKKELTNRIRFNVDGEEFEGFEGDTIASALLANGIRTLRVHEESGNPRGIYCNIGHCFECRVTVDGEKGIRACMTKIKENMKVERGETKPAPFRDKENKDLPKTYKQFIERNKNHKKGDLNV